MEGSKLDRFKAGTERLLGRTNERLKQKMGRSSESVVAKDDKWQVITANFNRQQAAGLRLHREVKGYIASLKTLESSTQTLLDAVREMHEYTWPGNMNLVKALQGLDKLNKELNESMVDSLLVPVNNYVEVFTQMKDKMQKRERKLLDYTRSKRSLDSLKKGDKISPEKLGFAQDNFTQNKMIFEEVNTELCEDLPELWNSRKTYIMRFLDGFFRSSVDFHKEFSQVYSESNASLDPLKEQIKNDVPPQRDIGNVDRYFVVSENARKFKRQSSRKSFRKSGSFKRSLSMSALRKSKKNQETSQSISNISVDPYASPAQQATVYTPTKASPVKKLSPVRPKPPRIDNSVNDTVESEPVDKETESADVKPRRDATPYSPSINVEPGTVVESIHEYKAVDDDELSFGTGDVITVVAWDSSDEQDAGWFMGVLQVSGAKGAFPINYTRKYNTNKNVRKADPDPLEDSFQSVDLSQDDEWRSPSKAGAEYMNLPELPEELPLTNGTPYSEESRVEVETVEYSYPPKIPPKRPAAPVIASPVTAEVPELAAAAKVDTPSAEVEVEVEVKAAAAISVETPEVELEVEKPEVSAETPAVSVEKPEVSVETPAVSVEKPEVSVETPAVSVEKPEVSAETPAVSVEEPEVSVETPAVSVEEPEVSVETPAVSVEKPEVIVETPEVSVETPESPAVSVEANVETSGAVEGSGAADIAVEVFEKATEDTQEEVEVPDVQLGLKAGIPVEYEMEVSVEAKVSDEDEDVAEVQTPTEESEESEEELSDSDSGDDLTPEEVQQKLAALGELSDENNESSESDEDELVSSSKVRFDTSVSVLESVPEDEGATDSEEESETSSVEDPGVDHTNLEDDDDVTAL